QVVEVERREVPEAADVVPVPVESELVDPDDREPGLLAQLAPGRALERLPRVHESAGNVEAPTARRVRAAQKQHAVALHHHHAGGDARIVVEQVAAARTSQLAGLATRRASDRTSTAGTRNGRHSATTAITAGSGTVAPGALDALPAPSQRP